MGLPDENWNLPSESYFKHVLLSELVKIAKIQEIANQCSISNNELFRYLDKLVSLFVSAERNVNPPKHKTPKLPFLII